MRSSDIFNKKSVANVAKTMVREHGQAMGALLLSNLSAQGELRGPGIVGTGPSAHRNVHAWLRRAISRVLGEFKGRDRKAKNQVETLTGAIQMGALDPTQLRSAVRLLGGKPRQKQWTASEASTARGTWGSVDVIDDWRRTMRHLSRIMAQFYGGVLRMPTGVAADGDMEAAFGLAALVDGGADNRDLTLARAIESYELIFEGFGVDCEVYRSELGATLPDLQAHVSKVYTNVVADMEQAELNFQQVKKNVEDHHASLRQDLRQEFSDLLISAGVKRDALGNALSAQPPPAAGASTLTPRGPPATPGQGKSRGAQQRRAKALNKAKSGEEGAASATNPAPGTQPTQPSGPATADTGTGAKLLASGQGFQLFAPERPLDTDVAVARAWGMAFHAGGTAPEDEPCGWKACFGKCSPKGDRPCTRDHNKSAPKELKAALKGQSTPAEQKRFSA